MKFLSVDRIEEDSYIICEDEDEEEHIIDISDTEGKICEGDILTLNDYDKWTKNESITKQQKKYILDLRKEIYTKE